MSTILETHVATVWSLLGLAALVVVQVAISTAATRKAAQVPGLPLTVGHESFAFRAFRAHQNTLENLPPFALAVAVALAAGVAPSLLGGASLGFLAARVGHAVAYYRGVAPARTAAFSLGLLAVVVILAAAALALVPRTAAFS